MKKAKMMEKLTGSQMCELVKLYKEYECLWDVSHELYKNREARDNAYREILEKLNVPRLKVRDIPQKIKNLRTSYYRKIDAWKKDGGRMKKPNVAWFKLADELLRTIPRNQYEPLDSEPEPTMNVKKINKVSTQKTIDTLDKIATNVTPQSKNEDDEYDSFGKYIASSLRSLSKEMSIIAKMELQRTIADVQLRSIRQRKRLSQPVQCVPSTSSACEDPLVDPLENSTVALEPDFSMSNIKTE